MGWTDEQREAIVTTGQDLCVTAAAGSGKTTVLIERVLHLVRECNVPLDRIVAITFTEKAAAEMKDRLRNECRNHEASASPEELAWWRKLAREVETARISTIHAFCAGLLRQHALACRFDSPLDPDFGVVDEAESHLLRAEVVDTALEELLEESHAETLRLAGYYGVYSLGQILGAFLRNPVSAHRILTDERYATPESILTRWQEMVTKACHARLLHLGASAELHKFRRQFEQFDGECSKPEDGRERLRRHALVMIQELAELKDPEKIERLIEAYANPSVKGTLSKNWSSPKVFEDIKEAQNAFKAFLTEYLTPERNEAVEQQCAELTRDAVACFRAVYDRYRDAKAARNVLDFTDLILLTHDLLEQQPEVCERVARGIDHLLIDEFQDTDAEQYAIARFLSKTAHPPEVFIVGDAKQSIYRFRGAEVEVFDRAKQGCRTIGLHKNFRTVPEIVNFVNALFATTNILEAVEPEYVRAEAFRPPVDECRVHILLADAQLGKDDAAGRRALEAAMLADWIAMACSGNLDVQVPSDGSGPPRQVTFGDFAMLFRAMSDVRIYERALAERNIPYHVLAGKGFYERQEVLDVRNLLEAVADPCHEPALLGFLRSPMAGLSDDALMQLCEGRGPVAAMLEEWTPDGFVQREALEHARTLLRELRAERERPLADFVRYVLERTGYEAMLAGLFLGEQRVCNVRKVVQLAEAFAETRRPRLSAFVRYLEDVAASEIEEGEAALQAEGSDEVTLMSIHKSKGLEFPVVILPDLTRKPTASHTSRVVFHRDFGAVARIQDPAAPQNPEPQIATVMMRDEDAKDAAERARMLYVAMTRARDWLVLGGSLDLRRSVKSLSKSLLEPFENAFNILEKSDGSRFGTDGWSAGIRLSTQNSKMPDMSRSKPAPPALEMLSQRIDPVQAIPAAQRTLAVTTLVHHMYPSDEERRREGGRAPDALDPLLRGTLIHRYFELWDFKKDPPEIDGFLRREQPILAIEDRLREDLETAVRRFTDSEAWALLSQAEDIEREVPFILRVGDVFLEGVVDAILDGTVILDYKTGLEVESRRRMYDGQLCLYAEALRRLRGLTPERAYIYYVDSGTLAEAAISDIEIATVLRNAETAAVEFLNEPMPDQPEAYLK